MEKEITENDVKMFERQLKLDETYQNKICCRCNVALHPKLDTYWIRTNIPLCDLCVEKQKPYMTETRINELLAEQFELMEKSELKRMFAWYKLFESLAGQTRISLFHLLLAEGHHNLLELVSLNEIEERLDKY